MVDEVRESRSMAAAATARAMAVATARATEVARGGGDVRERERSTMEGEAMVLDRRWRDRRGLLIGDGGRR